MNLSHDKAETYEDLAGVGEGIINFRQELLTCESLEELYDMTVGVQCALKLIIADLEILQDDIAEVESWDN